MQCYFGQDICGGHLWTSGSHVHDVLHALRQAGINITSLHNHFIDSNPDFYFVHYWETVKLCSLHKAYVERWKLN